MGLDLYHFKANAERRGIPFQIELWKGWDDVLAKLPWCVATTYQDQQFTSIAKSHYELFAILLDCGIETYYAEIAPMPSEAANVGRLFKLRPNKGVEMPALIALDHRGRIGLPTLYVEEFGYQRNCVARAFYDEFQPTEYVCALQRVARIRDLTDADERLDFKKQFFDTWSELESFVFVSW